MNRQRRLAELILSAPSILWLLTFFVVPTSIIFIIAFRDITPTGVIGSNWTLENFISIFTISDYSGIIWRTVWLSAAATVLSLVLAVPVAYFMARTSSTLRKWLLLLVIVPFWINFLVRVLAWMILLDNNGLLMDMINFFGLSEMGAALGLVSKYERGDQIIYSLNIMRTPLAVLIVMLYTELPFAILPIYAAAEKFDFSLLDAARDLGATSFKAFCKVFLPGIRRGLRNASLIVLIPCLGSYVIPELVGGMNSAMIGTKITNAVLNESNLPRGSAFASVLLAFVMAILFVVLYRQYYLQRRDRKTERL